MFALESSRVAKTRTVSITSRLCLLSSRRTRKSRKIRKKLYTVRCLADPIKLSYLSCFS